MLGGMLPGDTSPGDTRSHRPFRQALRTVAQLHGSMRRPLLFVGAVGAAAGIVEAAALVLFVRALVAITVDVDSADSGDRGVMAFVDASPGTLLLVAIVLAVAAAILHVVLARASVALGERVAVNSRRRLVEGFLNAQWSYVARYQEGRFQEAVSGLAGNASRATAHLTLAVSSIVIIVVLGVSALMASPLVTAALLLIPTVLVLLFRPFLAKLRERSNVDVGDAIGLAEATAATSNLALEYRTTGTQQRQVDRLMGIIEAHSARVRRTRSAGFTMTFLFKDSALIALIMVVGVLYLFTDLRSASLTAAVLLVIRMLGYLQQGFRLVQDGAEDLATVSHLRTAVLELDVHREPEGLFGVETVGELRLDGVGYRYEGGQDALDSVSLDVERNSTIGLAGPSGAGKSTLAEIMLGLRAPSTGSITVDGTPLGEVRRVDWTRLTAIVPQTQQLADVSIADNIRFLRDWISDDDVVDAAKRAHVHDEIVNLPGGYDYRIGSRSQGLSGGQRQRIAIARALVGRPQLLVLDEPTSALDAVTERLFRQTLDELHGKVTIIVIAHRPATLQVCDTVVHLRAGRIERIESGPRGLSTSTVT